MQRGQIAHLDKNAENNAVDNLVFLCLEHHDEYDSIPRQSKGLREQEVRRWRDELHREMEYRFRTVVAGPLLLQFDATRHKLMEENNQCGIFRVSVKNEGNTTVNNVGLKIAELQAVSASTVDSISRFSGLRLCVSESLSVTYRHPDNEPASSTLLHPADEAAFDVVRLCAAPGNALICHSGFYRNPQTKRLDHRPHGYVDHGFYRLSLRVHGDNVSPVLGLFEFGSNGSELVFRQFSASE